MLRAIPWDTAKDVRLSALLDKHGATLRIAAQMLGVSCSFAQRRAKQLQQVTTASICTPEREAAGPAPLPAGHPISVMAITRTLHA